MVIISYYFLEKHICIISNNLMTILLIARSTKTGAISIFVIFCAQCHYSAWGIEEKW